MCGITGYISKNNNTDKTIIKKMTHTLHHRGPDDMGRQVFQENGFSVAMGHKRLSILDLSSAGHQPMNFQSLWIVYNGEVYNYKEIKKDLEKNGYQFKSDSDTEVILKAWHYWGEEALKHFRGMFAFSIYDSQNKTIKLVRDRVGVKPLYYAICNEDLIYGSELKAICAYPDFKKVIDLRSLGDYFQNNHIPAPYSIYKNTYKVKQGEIVTYDCSNNELKKRIYWDASESYSKPKLQISYEEAKQELSNILEESFNYRMVSDVPVGVFLSGGYDSSAVTALLQKNRTEKLNTFTIGFEEGNNESAEARQTANYLGTNHHEMICTTKEAQELIKKAAYHYDEPLADDSVIPTLLVSKFAREHVTVALSADGGDEIFGGYTSYQGLHSKLQTINKIPALLKPALSSLLNVAETLTPKSRYKVTHQLRGVSKSLHNNKVEEALNLFKWAKRRPLSLMNDLFNDNYKEHCSINLINGTNPIESAMLYDLLTYLPDEILVKVDRAGMAYSLEGRDPFLDHNIIEFVAQLPIEYKFKPGNGKFILKDIVHDHLPKEMMDRPKKGFSIPMSSWLKGDLRDLFEYHLSDEMLKRHSIFDNNFIKDQKEKFYTGDLHYSPLMWKLFVFQLWYDEWM